VPLDELVGVDRISRFDLYVSTQRIYVLVDDVPQGCMDLPEGHLAPGSATVTVGDLLFGSTEDVNGTYLGQLVYPFHHDHMQRETRRHLDAFGFASGVGAPDWDHALVPCWPAP